MFKKILIANRGEIAVRIIRACVEMRIGTVAVYSDADRAALHVRMADEAIHIGPAPSRESYLVIENIIRAAKQTDADAIHPGYGFLSENAAFAQACADAGITFIGPSPKAIALMGSKVESGGRYPALEFRWFPVLWIRSNETKKRGPSRHLSVIPSCLKLPREAAARACVWSVRCRTDRGVRNTRAEAMAAFGDSAVYIEKFVVEPRHIEIQVFADTHGNAVYLGERECTIQRRHQKVIEECPSPVMDTDLRGRMGKAALDVVRTRKHTNAGTVEFLVDRNRDFYFLEMNTRLQVEHAVTEMVTGIDLVKEQISRCEWRKLGFSQDEVAMNGSAIECRIYAEDPENNSSHRPE